MTFYERKAWQQARRQALHAADYRCQRCGCSLLELGRNAHVHHRKPLDRAPALALEPLNLQALCASCHNDVEPRNPHASPIIKGCTLDGTPTDPRHPWNMAPLD